MDLCKAINLLRDKERKKCEVHILGSIQSEDYWAEIQDYVKQKQLESNICYDGFSDHVFGTMLNSDCVCVCSENEAFGRVTVEGMLAKCIVIGANTGGTAEIIQDGQNGLLYQQGDPTSLAERISYCINNSETVRRVADAGYHSAIEKYSDVSNAKRIQEVYDSVLGMNQ